MRETPRIPTKVLCRYFNDWRSGRNENGESPAEQESKASRNRKGGPVEADAALAQTFNEMLREKATARNRKRARPIVVRRSELI